jgi:pilus assembly protein CpaF
VTPRPGLAERVRRELADRGEAATPAVVAAAVRRSGVLGDQDVHRLAAEVHADLTGLGPLAPLLDDPAVSDVLVNGPGEVWVDRGHGLETVGARFESGADVRALAVRLAARCGRRLDDARPWVDARLPDGVRLHAVLPPLAPDGPLVSLRVPARRPFTLDDLLAAGSVPRRLMPVLRGLVAAACSIVVTGGTGAGKTTVLGALLGLVPPDQRIVLVEDAGELQPLHPHVVRLEARLPNVDGAGGVGLDVLVRQALRMRPDRLVVGEVRGPEVTELLAALNTGHAGGCGTVHANAAAELPARMEALGLAAGMARAAVHSQLGAGVDAVLHVARAASGQRHVAEVAVLNRAPDGTVVVEPAWRWTPGGPVERGPGAPRLEARCGTSVAVP